MSARDIFLSLIALFGFAVAQPLLDVLGGAPNFFAAHDLTRFEIVLLAITLAILAPVAGAAGIAAVWRANRTAGTALHGLAVAALAATLILQIAKQIAPLAAPLVLVGGALTAGIAAAFAYHRVRRVRDFVRWCAAGPLVFLGAFLFLSSTTEVLLPRVTTVASETRPVNVSRPATIVLIVFDELPVTSLMRPDYTIDGAAFPHFAALAADGTWFRNATAVHDFTNQAIPAILSGRVPKREIVFPSVANYPNNLFSLLADRYTMKVFETATVLCPENVCGQTSAPLPIRDRWEGLAKDIGLVGQHVFLPRRLTESLPPVDETLGNFDDSDSDEETDEDADADRMDLRRQRARNRNPQLRWQAFTASIDRSSRPALYFLHTMLTHRPWVYTPSGQRYRLPGNTPGKVGDFWNDDEWLVTQAQQRHLMQVAYADSLLGQAVERLKIEGLYDDALIVITADHGMSFSTGESLRRVHQRTVDEIAPVPLIVKRPGQNSGTVDDRLVSSLDILPSIAEVLEFDLPYPVDGRSLFDQSSLPRESSNIIGLETGTIRVTREARITLPSLERKFQRFIPGVDGFYRVAPAGLHDLLGASPPTAEAAGVASALINQLSRFDDVRLEAPDIPAAVSGTVDGLGAAPHVLAVALNGPIVAITRTFIREGKPFFTAILPPHSFRAGRNTLEIFVAAGEGPSRKLTRLSLTGA
jgi:hypothetical protein